MSEKKEITVVKGNGKDLDISRQSIIVMIKRKGKTIVPSGSIILLEGDEVVMYTRKESD